MVKLCCSDCIGLQDPYCAWEPKEKVCVAHAESNFKRNFLQNVARGEHKACPTPSTSTSIHLICLTYIYSLSSEILIVKRFRRYLLYETSAWFLSLRCWDANVIQSMGRGVKPSPPSAQEGSKTLFVMLKQYGKLNTFL